MILTMYTEGTERLQLKWWTYNPITTTKTTQGTADGDNNVVARILAWQYAEGIDKLARKQDTHLFSGRCSVMFPTWKYRTGGRSRYRGDLPSKLWVTVYRQKLTVMLRYRRKSTVENWFTAYRQKLTVNSHTLIPYKNYRQYSIPYKNYCQYCIPPER